MNEIKVTFHTNDSKNITLECEIAKSIRSKMKGLMHRESLEGNKGMFFQFFVPWHRFFYMKNVKIPLDIIFVNRKNRIITIHEAPVESGPNYKLYWSHGLCKYVIETNLGFCKKNNIKTGNRIEI
jgi:uncharacterized membrane protein (UPF0127 family)